MMRRPPWLSRGRLALVLGLAAAAATAITLLHRASERNFLAEYAKGLTVSAAFSADALSDRLRQRGATEPGAVLSESALPFFNIAAPDDRTQRTALIELRDGQLRLVAASRAGADRRTPATTPVPTDLRPDALDHAHYAGALRASADSTATGIGTGLAGRPVVYGIASVPGTPWRLLREREVEELRRLIRPGLILTDVIFAALALLVLAVLLVVWRSTFLRRETERVQLRATFVASISHELRTPLTQIRMYAEMLRLGLLAAQEDRERAIGVIEKESTRLSLLVERSLTFVRAGQALPADGAAAAIPVATALHRAAEAIAALADERGVRIGLDAEPGAQVRIAADDLHQVLLNLLDNAIKYGPAGQQVQLHATRREQTVRIEVRDEGPGVSAEEAATIWQPFIRGAAARDGSAGSGIGLVVVRDLVARAGGRTMVAPRVDGIRGATFIVELPSA